MVMCEEWGFGLVKINNVRYLEIIEYLFLIRVILTIINIGIERNLIS